MASGPNLREAQTPETLTLMTTQAWLKTRNHSTICLRVAQTLETTAPCQRKSHRLLIIVWKLNFKAWLKKPETTALFVDTSHN